MPRSILFVFLLIGTACTMHLEYLTVDESEEKHLDESWADDHADIEAEELQMCGGKIPVLCCLCKTVISKLKQQIGTKEKADVIKAKLHKVCGYFFPFKKECKEMVNKNIDKLTKELSTNDDSQTICAKIHVCKAKPPPELVQAFPEVQQML